MKTNFRNPATGKEFFIARYQVSCSSSGGIVYKENGKQIVDPDSGEILERTPYEGPIGVPIIFKSQNERRTADVAHFKQVAKKHAKSADSRDLRKQVIKKEFGVMGLHQK